MSISSLEPRLEDYIDRDEAAELMRCSPYTVRQYQLYGYRGVYLRTTLIGRKRYTTRQWIEEFNQRCTAADYVCALAAAEDAGESSDESIEAAREHLRAEGILPPANEESK